MEFHNEHAGQSRPCLGAQGKNLIGAGITFTSPKLINKKPRPTKWSGLFLPFSLNQCWLGRFRKLTFLGGLLTLAGNALTVTGIISKQVECV